MDFYKFSHQTDKCLSPFYKYKTEKMGIRGIIIKE